jgi:hypothetical protein
MPKAVLKNGVIYPVEPLPSDWADGKELEVNDPSDAAVAAGEADAWFAKMEALVADMTPEEDARLQSAIDEIRCEAKERARRKMGLSA